MFVQLRLQNRHSTHNRAHDHRDRAPVLAHIYWHNIANAQHFCANGLHSHVSSPPPQIPNQVPQHAFTAETITAKTLPSVAGG